MKRRGEKKSRRVPYEGGTLAPRSVSAQWNGIEIICLADRRTARRRRHRRRRRRHLPSLAVDDTRVSLFFPSDCIIEILERNREEGVAEKKRTFPETDSTTNGASG